MSPFQCWQVSSNHGRHGCRISPCTPSTVKVHRRPWPNSPTACPASFRPPRKTGARQGQRGAGDSDAGEPGVVGVGEVAGGETGIGLLKNVWRRTVAFARVLSRICDLGKRLPSATTTEGKASVATDQIRCAWHAPQTRNSADNPRIDATRSSS